MVVDYEDGGRLPRWLLLTKLVVAYKDGRLGMGEGHGGVVVRLLASHLGKPGSIPIGVTPGFLHVGVVPYDATGRICDWLVGFLGDLPLPSPFHSDAAPYQPGFTLIGSQDLGVKSYSYLFTHSPLNVRSQSYGVELRALECTIISRLPERKKGLRDHFSLLCACVESTSRHRAKGRLSSRLKRPGVDRGASTRPKTPACSRSYTAPYSSSLTLISSRDLNFAPRGAAVDERLDFSSPTTANRAQSTATFSQVGIVPVDAAGWRVFSGISRFPRHGIPALLHSDLIAPSSAIKTSLLRVAQISQLNSTNNLLLKAFCVTILRVKYRSHVQHALRDTGTRTWPARSPDVSPIERALTSCDVISFNTSDLSRQIIILLVFGGKPWDIAKDTCHALYDYMSHRVAAWVPSDDPARREIDEGRREFAAGSNLFFVNISINLAILPSKSSAINNPYQTLANPLHSTHEFTHDSTQQLTHQSIHQSTHQSTHQTTPDHTNTHTKSHQSTYQSTHQSTPI
ncbi:hypothetical protein PR048_002184 [Dryococelus australis]|uniref:Uncharacterized protein n=1 Tax=Dryococelus australis TaxID=614101 RepID=A0ABQ9IJH5_9NEOP|nr:hypothetical protein PR048_002184 [Dryococelus australis]